MIFSSGGLRSKSLNYIVCFEGAISEFLVFDLDFESFLLIFKEKIALKKKLLSFWDIFTKLKKHSRNNEHRNS